MKKARNVLLLLLCAALLVGATVMGTLAYLKSTTETITNTFTVGNVTITLAETTGTEYHLVPGNTIKKDPTITVGATSEDCYLFVKVENELTGAGTITWAEGWTQVGTSDVWQYKEAVEAGAVVPVFTNFVVDKTLDNTALAAYADKTIKVTGYAIQSANLNTDQALTELGLG